MDARPNSNNLRLNQNRMLIQRAVDCRRLTYYIAVAEAGSIASAARQLNLAQPSLSHHIKDMERLLGVALFNRHPRGVSLTEAGNALLEHARLIVEAIDRGSVDLQRIVDRAPRRPVRVAMIRSWAIEFAPALIAATHLAMPDISLQILEVRDAECESLLATQRVDLTVTLQSHDDGNDDLLVRENLLLVSSSPLDAKVAFSALKDRPLILAPKENSLRRLVDQQARKSGIVLHPHTEIEGLDTTRRAVHAGIGQAILSQLAVRGDIESGRLYGAEIVAPALTRPVFLRHGGLLDSETLKRFRMLLLDVYHTVSASPS